MNHPTPALFCKPSDDSSVLFSRPLSANGVVTLRSLNPTTDLETLYQWVNAAYAKRFWQMAGPFETYQRTYVTMQAHPSAHSFVLLFNDQLLGQADVYCVGADELCQHLPEDSLQCGVHFLVAPPQEHSTKGLSVHFLNTLLAYYFSFPQAERIYGEPDCRNDKVHLLIRRCRFRFLKQVQLSSKTANLFCLDRHTFLHQ